MSTAMTAAVIGASGIGKHHAKWLHALGCEVAGFAGSGNASVAATGQMLHEQLGIQARGYTDVETMLAEVKPDLVSICSPPAMHRAHFLAAAVHGCHIMCEKPLAWDEAKSPERLLEEAAEMGAYGGGRIAGAVNTQYVAAVAPYLELCRQVGSHPGLPVSFFMQMDSRDTQKRYGRVWIDLASHPLSVLMEFCGPGRILPGSAQVAVGEQQTVARFDYEPHSGPVCAAEIVVRAGQTEKLVRRFGINGILADYEGRNDEAGIFRTWLSIEGREACSDDLMYLSLSRFVQAARGETPRPLATLSDGYMNQAMQLALLQAANGTSIRSEQQ